MDQSKTLSWLKRNWGLAIFTVDIVAALFMNLLKPVAAHYLIFSEPARALWGMQDPYDIVYPGANGAFFYSPGCALYFFGLFKIFPDKVGQFLYVAFSASVYCLALFSLLRAIAAKGWFDYRTSPYRHLLWLMAGSEMIGGLVAVKIDVVIAAASLFFLDCFLRERKMALATLLLGLMASWKIHPLMVFGLVASAMLARDLRLALRTIGLFAVGLVAGLLSPCLVLPLPFVKQVTVHWNQSLAGFVSRSWLDDIFQHLYGFVARTFHVGINLKAANILTALCGLISAILVFVWARRRPLPLMLLVAVGLGSGFAVMFSHLIQSNSYIIYFPLVIATLTIATMQAWDRKRTIWFVAGCYFVISIVYSDLVPRPMYHLLFDMGVKPLGVLALYLTVMWAQRKSQPT